jgi:hypothetical protein
LSFSDSSIDDKKVKRALQNVDLHSPAPSNLSCNTPLLFSVSPSLISLSFYPSLLAVHVSFQNTALALRMVGSVEGKSALLIVMEEFLMSGYTARNR